MPLGQFLSHRSHPRACVLSGMRMFNGRICDRLSPARDVTSRSIIEDATEQDKPDC